MVGRPATGREKIKKIKDDTSSQIKPTIILKGLQLYRKKKNDVGV
jgi:hypothetical protein